MSEHFLPEVFWFDSDQRVARQCPRCGCATYAPGPSGWESRYWSHAETDAYACSDGVAPA